MIVFHHELYDIKTPENTIVKYPFEYYIRYLTEKYPIMPKSLYSFVLFGNTPNKMYTPLTGLYPKPEYVTNTIFSENLESNFDYQYWKQLIEDPESSMLIKSILKIEYELGPDCLITIQIDDRHEGISEYIFQSLQLYLREAYGIAPAVVYTTEDVEDFVLNMDKYPNGFSSEGLDRITRELQEISEAEYLKNGGSNNVGFEPMAT